MFNRVSGRSTFGSALFTTGSDLPVELQELIRLQNQAAPNLSAAEESNWPLSIYIPERFEENYAYPLFVWFHDDGHHEGQVETVMSAISTQNYCGLGIQGNQPMSGENLFGWNTAALEYGPVKLKDLLGVTVRRMRQAFHIHSERIFLAGSGTGADVALQQLSLMPDWYAGAVVFNPECPDHVIEQLSAANFDGQSVLWTVPRTATNETLARNVDAIQLARLSGMTPDLRVTETPINPEDRSCRFVDHWLLAQICSEAMV